MEVMIKEGNWVNPQIKDHFYDQFLKEPTKDNFRDFMKKSCGELNEMDFKETWIDKGPLAKIMLAMANNGGGIIVFGVKENEDNTFDILGLDSLKDTADISNSISRLVSSSLDYEVFNFVFDSDVYGKFENKKFQIMVIHDTPERLPFVSLGQSEKIEKDVIYVRRGTKSEKATSEEINRIIERKIATIYSENTDMSLDQHLEQLKKLYGKRFSPEVVGVSTTSADERFSQKLYEIIEKNISDQNLGIEMLCDQIGISRANLYRKIKAISELSPTELIRNKRLEVALRYLKETNMSVSEVATLLGFNSHSYFSNSFKAFYGFTPTEFVQMNSANKEKM